MNITTYFSGVFLLIISFAGSLAKGAVGHISFSQGDPSRPGRTVTAEIFYPALSDGDNTPWQTGSFPLIVLGHGFLMDYEVYRNIWEALVPEGYVMAICTNETGALPNHNNFGLDLRFIATYIQEANGMPESIFYQHFSGRSACMGHSMGGGASVLASEGNDDFDCYVGLAPANTNPSAIIAAANANLPSLIISGDADAVTPPNDHHIPIYNGFGSICKYYLNIIEGSHCYFADSGSLCDWGEFNTGDLDRGTQQSITHTALQHWFNTWLRDENELEAFENWALENPNTELESDCMQTDVLEGIMVFDRAYPNPCSMELFLHTQAAGPFRCTGVMGENVRIPDAIRINENTWKFDTSALPNGRYVLHFGKGDTLWFVVSR